MKVKHPRRLVQSEKIQLLSRIGQLLEQGYSLLQAIEIILASSSTRQRFWLEKIVMTLEQGKSIEEAFRAASFSEQVVLIIAQAEWHGHVVEAFKQATLWKQRKMEIKKEWQKVLTYPILLLFILISILYVIFNWVIPQFLMMFQAFHLEIPDITLRTVRFFQWWQDVYPTLIVLLVLISLMLFFGWRYSAVKERLISLMLNLPWIKTKIQDYYTILFAVQLGSLLQANIPLNLGMDRLIKSSGSNYLKTSLSRMEQKILAGQSVAQAVQAERCFSGELYPVVYYAERKGELGQQLIHYGIHLEADVITAWLRRIKLVEPVLLVGIGLFIAFLFYALFTPVLELITIL